MKSSGRLTIKSFFTVVIISLVCINFTGCLSFFIPDFLDVLSDAIKESKKNADNNSKPFTKTPEYHEWYFGNVDKIMYVLKTNAAHITDITNDGKINCQDYSVSYYLLWKETYPNIPIELVYNTKVKNTSHLFVRIYSYNRWEPDKSWFYIEPQHERGWRIEEVWGSYYNSELNVYGETEYWLERCLKKNK